MEPTELTETPDQTLAGDIYTSDTSDTADTGDLVDDELLVEEISIDGMCGVY